MDASHEPGRVTDSWCAGWLGPFWRELLLGNYFRLWSAPVHTWLKRHCIDDLIQIPVGPLQPLTTHSFPTMIQVPRTPTTPPPMTQVPEVGPTTEAAHRDTATPEEKQKRLDTHRSRSRSRVPGGLAAVIAFAVSAYLHEVILYMCTHTFTWPWILGALMTLAVTVAVERKLKVWLPHGLLTLAMVLGHVILFMALARSVIPVVQAM